MVLKIIITILFLIVSYFVGTKITDVGRNDPFVNRVMSLIVGMFVSVAVMALIVTIGSFVYFFGTNNL